MGVAPGGEFLIQASVGEDHSRIRQCGDEDRDLRGRAGDRVGDPHWGSGPVDLHRVPRGVRDRAGEVVGADVFGDDLAEPFIPVVPCRWGRCWGVEVAGPQHFQWWLLPPDPSVDDRIDIDRDEVPVGAFAAVGEEPVEVVDGEGIDLVPCCQRFFLDDRVGFRDRAVGAAGHRFDLSVGVSLNDQGENEPVVGHEQDSFH